MEPPAFDWAIKNLNSDPDRLRIKSYDYNYRRYGGVVNEILRKFVMTSGSQAVHGPNLKS